MKIIDISRKFFSCDVYPGDPKPKAERLACIGEGGDCNITAVHASAHTAPMPTLRSTSSAAAPR